MLIRQGDYKTARTLLKHMAHNNKTGLFKELKKEYLVNTSLWQQLRKLKPRKVDWRNKATFHTSFLKKYNLLLDTKEDVDHRVSMKKIINSGNIGRLTGRFANREAHLTYTVIHHCSIKT